MKRLPPAVLGLVIVNVALFLAAFILPHGRAWLVGHGAFWFTENPNFAPWQFVTYMFLHGGPGHIFFNMFALVSFGSLLELQWGPRRFLLFYFLCGVGAAVIYNVVNAYQFGAYHEQLVAKGMTSDEINFLLRTAGEMPPDADVQKLLLSLYQIYAAPMLGASGAIYGTLVAFGFLYPNAKLSLMFVPVPVAAKYFIPAMLTLDLFSGVTGFSLFGGGIAHFAHLGGALIGFILMLVWRRRIQTAEPRFGS